MERSLRQSADLKTSQCLYCVCTASSSVLYLVASCSSVPINDLLDRVSQRSDKIHSLSTTLSQELVGTSL